MFPKKLLIASLNLSIALLTLQCGKAKKSTSPQNDDFALSENISEVQSLGKLKRFALGEAIFLPLIESQSELSWSVQTAPTDSEKQTTKFLRERNGKYVSFTPSQFGKYTFVNKNTLSTLSINVIDRKNIPFQNYNYYPTKAVLGVSNQSLWVADTLRAKILQVNPENTETIGEWNVGSWPVALAEFENKILVVQKGSDTVGLFNTETKTLEQTVWVGDEPSEIVVAKNRKKAFVSLSTRGAIAVLNLENLGNVQLEKTVETVRDARALALSTDEKTLFVSSFRSGQVSRHPYGNDPLEEEKDIEVFSVESMKSEKILFDIGTTIQSLKLSEDNKNLYVSRLKNITNIPLQSQNGAAFQYEIASLNVNANFSDAEFGKEKMVAKLSVAQTATLPAPPSTPAKETIVAPSGMTIAEGKIWFAAEGNDLLVALNESDFSEFARFPALGRPKSVAVLGNSIFAYGHQNFQLTKVNTSFVQNNETLTEVIVPTTKVIVDVLKDPRPTTLAKGQSYYTGAGGSYAKNWSCNSCHVEGRSDTLVWNAGPVKDTHVSRPFFFLEGTHPLGWQGYMSNLVNYSNEVHTNIGRRPTTETSKNLEAYLSSLTVPPAENDFTSRFGRLSATAKEGEKVFSGKGNCAGCHAMPLGTARLVMETSSTEDRADIPSVVGSYTHGVWLKHGEARTLKDAVVNMTNYAGAILNDQETSNLTRYLQELTGRDFFVLALGSGNLDFSPADKSVPTLPIDESIEIKFSVPFFASAENFANNIQLRGKNGNIAKVTFKIEGPRKLRVVPEPNSLAYDSEYRLEISNSLESDQHGLLSGNTSFTFQTQKTPLFSMTGKYVLRVELPKLTRSEKGNYFDRTQLTPVDMAFTATETLSGAKVTFDFGQEFLFSTLVTLSGDEFYLPPTPVQAGPFSFADSFQGFKGKISDTNADGIGDFSEGTFVYSGPGFLEKGLNWKITKVVE